jgi:hypothetical protein
MSSSKALSFDVNAASALNGVHTPYVNLTDLIWLFFFIVGFAGLAGSLGTDGTPDFKGRTGHISCAASDNVLLWDGFDLLFVI